MNRIVRIAWYGKHFGEEPPLVGDESQGAGTIFFSGCNLHCVFCQNYQISQEGMGKSYSIEDLAGIMLELQERGAINIDLVTPTVWWRQTREAILIAKRDGLTIPIVWNSNAYEDLEIIEAMAGLVDIYLPDFKYSDDNLAWRYSKIKNYSMVAEQAVSAMSRQVGGLQLENSLAKKGVIIRHLVLPGHLPNTFGVLEKITAIDKNIYPHTKRSKPQNQIFGVGVYISLMGQYIPLYWAKDFPEINRRLTNQEFKLAENKMAELELNNGWLQELDSAEMLVPDFRRADPF